MGLKALEGIQQNLRTSDSKDWLFLMMGVAALLLFVVLLKVLISELGRQRRMQTSWQEFSARIAHWGLSGEQGRLLSELARLEAPTAPMRVVEKPEAFEDAVHRYLKARAALGRPALRTAADLIAGIRARLNMAIPAGLYHSSRELKAGQELHLTAKSRSGRFESWAVLAERREDFLEMTLRTPPRAALAGRGVHVMFFSASLAFSFESEIVEVDEKSGICLLAHSLNIRTAGLREFHRVDIERAITFRAAWEAADVRREGILLNLSAGGLALLCPCYFEGNEKVTVDLRPAELLAQRRGAGPDGMEDRQISGSIVRARRTADGRCNYHVEFRDISAAERQYLFRFVQQLQLSRKRSAAE